MTVAFLESNTENDEAPELVQVVWVTRHGLRTPLSGSSEIIRGLPWECLSKEETEEIFTTGVELHRADAGPEPGMAASSVSRTRLAPGLFEPHLSGDIGTNFGKNCHSGQLTLVGHKVRGQGCHFSEWTGRESLLFAC